MMLHSLFGMVSDVCGVGGGYGGAVYLGGQCGPFKTKKKKPKTRESIKRKRKIKLQKIARRINRGK